MTSNKIIKTFLTEFAIGGTIIGTTAVIAQNLGSKWASLFWSIPFSFLPVLFMLYRTNGDWKGHISYSTLSSIILLLTFIGMYASMKIFGDKFYTIIASGILIWTILAILYSSLF